jgi:hypothetical protein
MRPGREVGLRFLAVLALAGALAVSCFHDLRLPRCQVPGDCPAGFTVCEQGYCLYDSGHCQDGPAANDGCCYLGEGDRSGDGDCVAFGREVAPGLYGGPVGGADGAVYLSLAGQGAGGAPRVLALALASDGREAWRRDLAAAPGAEVWAPVVAADGVWFPAPGLMREYCANGDEARAVVAEEPYRGWLAARVDGAVAWWRAGERSLALLVPGQAEPGRVPVAQVEAPVDAPRFTSDGRYVLVAGAQALASVDLAGGVVAGALALEGLGQGSLLVSGERVYAVHGGTISALSLVEGRPASRWEQPLGGEARGAPVAAGEGRVLVPLSGHKLAAVLDQGVSGVVRAVDWPWAPEVAGGLLAWADGRVLALTRGEGQDLRALRALRVTWGEEGVELAPAWYQEFGNPLAGALTRDSQGRALVMDGAGFLYKVLTEVR